MTGDPNDLCLAAADNNRQAYVKRKCETKMDGYANEERQAMRPRKLMEYQLCLLNYILRSIYVALFVETVYNRIFSSVEIISIII